MLLTRLKYWREYRGLSLRQLAEKSKIPYSAISVLENGKREPQGRTVHKLAQALGVEVYELFEQAQTANHNKTITPARPTGARPKKQPASAPAPASGFWVFDEDDTFGPFAQVEAERLKGKLGRARVYQAVNKVEANKQHTEFLREVARGREAW